MEQRNDVQQHAVEVDSAVQQQQQDASRLARDQPAPITSGFKELLVVGEPVPSFEELLQHGAFDSTEGLVRAYRAEHGGGVLQSRDNAPSLPVKERSTPPKLRIDALPRGGENAWSPTHAGTSPSSPSGGRLSPLAIMKKMARPRLATRAHSSSVVEQSTMRNASVVPVPRSPLIANEPRRASSGGSSPILLNEASTSKALSTPSKSADQRQPRKLKKARPASLVSVKQQEPSYFDCLAQEPEPLLSPRRAQIDDHSSKASFSNMLSRTPSPIHAFPTAATRESTLPPISSKKPTKRWSSASSSDSYHADEEGMQQLQGQTQRKKQSSSDSSDSNGPKSPRWPASWRNSLGGGHRSKQPAAVSDPAPPLSPSFEVLNRRTDQHLNHETQMSANAGDPALDSIAEQTETSSLGGASKKASSSPAAASPDHTIRITSNRSYDAPIGHDTPVSDKARPNELLLHTLVPKRSAQSLTSSVDAGAHGAGIHSETESHFSTTTTTSWKTGSEGGEYLYYDSSSGGEDYESRTRTTPASSSFGGGDPLQQHHPQKQWRETSSGSSGDHDETEMTAPEMEERSDTLRIVRL